LNGATANPQLRERRQRRRHATRPLAATLDRHPIQIVDLSLGGLGFETSAGLHPFDRYQVCIPTERGELRATGHLVWCRIASTRKAPTGEVTPVYRGGIRLDPLERQESERLLALLDHLKSPAAAVS